jgi:radial spoke head protein 4A
MAEYINTTQPKVMDEAKAFLMKSDSNGNNLFDHLTDVLLKILEEKPQQAFDVFETISTEVKKSKLQPTEDPGHKVHNKTFTL